MLIRRTCGSVAASSRSTAIFTRAPRRCPRCSRSYVRGCLRRAISSVGRPSIRSPPRRKAPPAILLANQLTNNLLHEALGMHVFTVLAKPVDFNLLLDSLARVLRRYHESRWPTNEG